ncbi:MAG TPA: acetate kinase [Spirochaetia bacterium]|nr:acetate kinase [Spirochaetia bacterium]
MIVLVINSGSSSIKFQVIRMDDRSRLCAGLLERIGLEDGTFTFEPDGREKLQSAAKISDHSQGIGLILQAIADPQHGVLSSVREIAAVGHRVVHGGETIRRAELVTPRVEAIIEECGKLAPLHNPANLTGIRAVRNLLPSVPQVGVFDTAFHATMPEESFLFALPYGCYQEHGIRRFGFHGTSHRFVSRRAAEILGRDTRDFACVSCHMGNGVSIAAIRDGRSVDTSLGFGTMCGAPMGTRAGDVDPAAVLYMIDALGMSSQEVRRLLYYESGLKGVSGLSSDMRDIVAAAGSGNRRAALALQVFAHGCRRHIASLATSLGGRLDALIFTAGIGEHSPESRRLICQGLEVLGIEIDDGRNAAIGVEATISSSSSRVPVLVVPTNEELMIAIETEEAIGRRGCG